MKRKIIFGLLWAVVFAALTFFAEMLIYALLGFGGIASWKQSTVVFIGRSLAWLMLAMAVLGLVLGLRGVLPGTRPGIPQI